MKTLTKILSVILIVFATKADAQISLTGTYPSAWDDGYFQSVYLEHSGFKFVYLHSDSLTFYNLNLSLFKNVIIPGGWPAGTFVVSFISEGLFDLDTSHIDYVFSPSACCPLSITIFKDDGTTIFRKDSAALVSSTLGMSGAFFVPIMPTDSGTFMAVTLEPSSSPTAVQLYRLPGSLPCIPGCSSFSTSIPSISNNGNTNMTVFPNPSNNYSNVYYSLPPGINEGEIIVYDLAGREVKRYTVTRQFDHLQISTSDIRAGTYFYQLMANGNNISTKKIVVVK